MDSSELYRSSGKGGQATSREEVKRRRVQKRREENGRGKGRQRCLTCDSSHSSLYCTVAPAPAPRANDGTWTQRGDPARTALHLSLTERLRYSAANPCKASVASPCTGLAASTCLAAASGCVCLRCGGEMFGLQSFQPVWSSSGPPSSLSCLRYTSVCHPLKQLPEPLAQGTQSTVAAVRTVAWLVLPQVSATCFHATSVHIADG